MEIYLDNSATTKVDERVAELMMKTMVTDYGNPSSMHKKGIDAEHYVKEAADTLAKIWKVDAKNIVFTSCGTESDNLALIGAARANCRAGRHIITTAIEHPAILNTMAYLEDEGFRITYLPVDANGQVRLEDFEQAVCEDTILASVMHVNNEIGAVQPIKELSTILHSKRPDALFHTDAVQSFGKYRIFPKRDGIDMISISGHKIHGPKGIGALYISSKAKVKPIMYGGGQQSGMRSGTHNVPGIAGIGLAAKLCYDDFDQKIEQLYALKKDFIEQLEHIDGVTVNGWIGRECAPHIVSASFDGLSRAEVLLHALEDYGIYVSAGSACATNKPEVSKTLKAIGLKKEHLSATLRFSFSTETTKEELDQTILALKELLPRQRLITKR